MAERRVSSAAVGDIVLDQSLSKIIEKRGPGFLFLNVAPELQDADTCFRKLGNASDNMSREGGMGFLQISMEWKVKADLP